MITATKFAMMLTGREYRDEMTDEEELIAKESGLIVIFGQSDDLIEFRGMIRDEIDAYDGTDFIIAKPGTLLPTSEKDFAGRQLYVKADQLEPYPVEEGATYPNLFKAIWCPNGDGEQPSWRITTNLPHTTFNIMEDDEVYCEGIVINVNDLT